MPSYLDVESLRAYAGIASTVPAEVLAPFLDAVEYQLQLHVGYDPVYGTRTQYFDGDGTDRLALGPHVRAVASVHENERGFYQPANFTADELLTAGEHYVAEAVNGRLSGVLRRINARWPYRKARKVDALAPHLGECYGCVRVVFTQGLSPPEMNLLRAVGYQSAAALWAVRRGVGPKTSESLNGYSYSLANLLTADDLPVLVSKFAAALAKPLVRAPLA